MVEVSTRLVYRDEKPIGVQGIARDITEQMRTEAALRESEEQHRILAETASDAIITINEDSRILFVNPSVERIFGYTRAELLGQELTMLMPEYLRQVHKTGIQHHLATGKKHIAWHGVELPGLHKNGEQIPLEISFGKYVKDGAQFFTGIVRDISERKRVESALQESEAHFRAVAECAPCAILIYQGSRFRYVNPATEQQIGRASCRERV